jgi:hypothetical protein
MRTYDPLAAASNEAQRALVAHELAKRALFVSSFEMFWNFMEEVACLQLRGTTNGRGQKRWEENGGGGGGGA